MFITLEPEDALGLWLLTEYSVKIRINCVKSMLGTHAIVLEICPVHLSLVWSRFFIIIFAMSDAS